MVKELAPPEHAPVSRQQCTNRLLRHESNSVDSGRSWQFLRYYRQRIMMSRNKKTFQRMTGINVWRSKKISSRCVLRRSHSHRHSPVGKARSTLWTQHASQCQGCKQKPKKRAGFSSASKGQLVVGVLMPASEGVTVRHSPP